jgi:hypothetical protein
LLLWKKYGYNHQFAGLAQLVEQRTCNAKVEGSTPLAGTTNISGLPHKKGHQKWWPFFYAVFLPTSCLLLVLTGRQSA